MYDKRGLTGLSYASLGSRYPRAGGAAYITQRAYRRSLLTHVVGLTVACSGPTSVAAGARVVGENLQALPDFEGLPTGALAFVYQPQRSVVPVGRRPSVCTH